MTSTANMPAIVHDGEMRQRFALWAGEYDAAPNPMLSLEERYLPRVLPRLDGKEILDVGCGTGRWLKRLANSTARRLTGIDFSSEMLARATGKLAQRAVLAVGSATALPIANSSADVVLASFVVSYVDDLDAFSAEIRRVARDDSRIYLSDVHPETARACNWKRAFRSGGEHVDLTTCPRSLAEVAACFRRAGFRTTCLLEIPFELAELEIFRRTGKLEAFYAAAGQPAIYILELQPGVHRRVRAASPAPSRQFLISGARIALDGDSTAPCNIETGDERIVSIRSSSRIPGRQHDRNASLIDLDGYLLLPGLINAHDHLEFGLYPKLGRGPYRNCSEWATDIQHQDKATIAMHQAVPREVRVWWGAIRNLLCGVTTVCHHNPLYPELLSDNFPIRVIKDFGWAHSLAMDAKLSTKFRSLSSEFPFVLHACEGVDETSAAEIFTLDACGALDHRTVLVHGLALNRDGIDLLNRRSSALVWCPTSNNFLFGRTHTREKVASVHALLLGSDSPLTADGDLLDDMRFARRETGISAGELYRMVFDKAPAAFRLRQGEGTIRASAVADLVAVRDRGLHPAETLADLSAREVHLVIVRGRVQLASEEVLGRLPSVLAGGLRPLQVGSTIRWIRAPLAWLFRETERVLGSEIKLAGKRVRHVCTAWL